MKIPFGMLPAHWGLKGKTKETVRAEYMLKDEALEKRLNEINSETEEELSLKNLKVDRKYKNISKEEYDYKYVELTFDGDEESLAKLALDKKYDKLSESGYEKAVCTLKGEPWVGVVGSEYKPDQGTSGFSFELDWNEEFIEMCVEAGYGGMNAEQIVEQWFEDVATEEYYKEITKTEQEYLGSGPVNSEQPAVTRTTHERIDDTKTKHS